MTGARAATKILPAYMGKESSQSADFMESFEQPAMGCGGYGLTLLIKRQWICIYLAFIPSHDPSAW